MTCYHPLAAERLSTFSQSILNKKGKLQKIKILGKAEDILNMDLNDSVVSKYILIPCGSCIGCRIDKARDWSVRIMCESWSHPNSSWFLTLTYDDDHLGSLSLDKKDFQKFIKDLRNYISYRFDISIRYFGNGEYGDKFGRKHFHIIIFDLPELDFVPSRSSNGHVYYKSKILEDIWGKGFVDITEVNISTAAYVAKYVMKKLGAKEYEKLNIQPPFLLMSNRPGIGYDYWKVHKDALLSNPYIFCDHRFYPLPRYFKRLFVEQCGIPVDTFNDDYVEKKYKINLIKEIYSKKKMIDLLRDEELNVIANQKERSL